MTNVVKNYIVHAATAGGVGVDLTDQDTIIVRNNILYNVDTVMDGVRDYRSAGGLVALSTELGRLVVSTGGAAVDLLDLIGWLKQHRPELLTYDKKEASDEPQPIPQPKH